MVLLRHQNNDTNKNKPRLAGSQLASFIVFHDDCRVVKLVGRPLDGLSTRWAGEALLGTRGLQLALDETTAIKYHRSQHTAAALMTEGCLLQSRASIALAPRLRKPMLLRFSSLLSAIFP